MSNLSEIEQQMEEVKSRLRQAGFVEQPDGSFKKDGITAEVSAKELSEFDRWFEEFKAKRLRGWSADEIPTLCGIAHDAWNAAVEQAAKKVMTTRLDVAGTVDAVRTLKA